MLKKIFLISLFSIPTLFSQINNSDYFKKNGEVYFKFKLKSKTELNQLTRIISIDNVTDDSVFCYANEDEFNNFLKLKIEYRVLSHPGDVKNIQMSSSIKDIKAWDVYPTYDAYVQMMYQFQNQYPAICRIVDAGSTVQGRKILFAVISDSINTVEKEPKFMYSSSMHGDETTGYVLMLRLIDSLLSTYGIDQRVTNLVNNVEIWINPLANPDGTYRSGNNTVSGARRYNFNNIDLNRNFPDPQEGQHPDGKTWQPEAIAMMNLAEQNYYVLSANFHGGAEVVNYPWDTWAKLHADDNWFQFISHLYADTVQDNSPSNYMRGFNDGITNGYAWYRVTGGRQDYFTYFKKGREVTIEISNTKLLNASLLPSHWYYNRKSFIQYIENCFYGIKGVVTDLNGNSIKAKIKIENFDKDNSEIFSDSLTGYYIRMINSGTYTVTFSADSFETISFPNISVSNFSSRVLNVQMTPVNPVPVELSNFSASIKQNVVTLTWQTISEKNNKGFEIQKSEIGNEKSVWHNIGFVEGIGTTLEKQNYFFNDKFVNTGKYLYRLKQIDFDGTNKIYNPIEVCVSISSGQTSNPLNFSLEQNYPNPFNPSTHIRYSINSKEKVSLKVYDVLGNEVAISHLPDDEFKEQGNYELEINGQSLPNGVYFYQLKIGNQTSTKSMILIK